MLRKVSRTVKRLALVRQDNEHELGVGIVGVELLQMVLQDMTVTWHVCHDRWARIHAKAMLAGDINKELEEFLDVVCAKLAVKVDDSP